MKKIVLRSLPPEIERSIKRKALNDDLSREEAVVQILKDAELQRMIERDVAMICADFEDDEKPF